LSGPAAGVIAASAIAGAAGFANIITCDMGGTSFDVSLVADGKAALASQSSVDFGMVVRTPMIEITTIGAGGGSIASIDASGLLKVGPESAGSDPGPVCYGLGNDRPTVTDANLVVGRINPDNPIGGKLDTLDIHAARDSINRHIALPLEMSIESAADAILQLANAKMAGAIRLVSVEQGHDPATFVAMPFGGGGALHTGALIREVGLRSALVPRYPGVTSALGCVVADMRQDRVQTVNRLLSELDAPAMGREMRAVVESIRALLFQADIEFKAIEHELVLDMLYVGQTHTVGVTIEWDDAGLSKEVIQQSFDQAYQATYGRLLQNIPARVMNYRVAVIGKRPEFDMRVFAPVTGKFPDKCKHGTRRIYVAGKFYEAVIYDRLSLAVDSVIHGPAILEQADTTIFIDPGLAGTVDEFGNLLITEREVR
jgi:N-methylhydantoinase A